jgi:DNA polymerase-3 subunit gamma/tau
MSYEVTASRCRPKSFSTMLGQDFVATAISQSITIGNIAHAYLFTGPRGVGKTSSARILASSLNCLSSDKPISPPCGQCTNCQEIALGNSMDVIEIDGASNTSVNDVREIKDEILFQPSHARYKIYIIDEVHMLSQGAFNALLKTIEEPPAYVKFIFATTESHKIPATIKSRCQQFNFRLIDSTLIKHALEKVATDLNLQADDAALFWLAKEAKGSMRDAYTLFDQVIAFCGNHITLEKIEEKIGIVGIAELNQLLNLCLQHQGSQAQERLEELFHKGISVDQFISDLCDYFHALLLIKHGVNKTSLLGFPLSQFDPYVFNTLSISNIEVILSKLFLLYRDLKFSINPDFELRLLISQISHIETLITPEELLAQITQLKTVIQNSYENTTDHAPVIMSEPVAPATPNWSGATLQKQMVESLKRTEPTLANHLTQTPPWQINAHTLSIMVSGMRADDIERKMPTIVAHLKELTDNHNWQILIDRQPQDAPPKHPESLSADELLINIFNGEIIKS